MKFANKHILFPIIASAALSLSACQPTSTTQATTTTTAATTATASIQSSLTQQALPDFNIVDQQHTIVTKDTFAGKPTVYIAWASWCPDCQQQMPILNELHQEYSGKVQFVFVNMLVKGETAESGQQYLKDNNYAFAYYADEQHEFQKNMHLESIPTMILVNKEGTVQQVFDEVQTKDSLNTALQSLL